MFKLFQWGADCSISYERDPLDFVMVKDPETGKDVPDYRVLWILYDCPALRRRSENTGRDATFRYWGRDVSRATTTISKDSLGVTNIPIFISVIRESDVSWEFTPEHVPSVPGSVSVPTLLDSGSNGSSPTSDTTASVTASSNALLGTGWALRVNSGAGTITYTDTHAGNGAWSQLTADGGTPNTVHNSQARSQAQAGGSSGTITGTYTGSVIRSAWVIWEITGHDTATPVSESNTGGANNGTSLSISIADINADNMAISSATWRENTTITVGSGETELAEATGGATFPVVVQVQYSDTTTAHDWSVASDGANAGTVIEYAAAAGGGAAAQVILID